MQSIDKADWVVVVGFRTRGKRIPLMFDVFGPYTKAIATKTAKQIRDTYEYEATGLDQDGYQYAAAKQITPSRFAPTTSARGLIGGSGG